MTEKSCGTCNLCCKLLAITELKKTVNVWCQFAKPGCGCSIYTDKPESCNVFKCVWLAHETLGPEFKPDRLGGVMAAMPDGENIQVHVPPREYMTFWRKPEIMRLASAMLGINQVLAITDGRRTMAFGTNGPGRWKLCEGTVLSQSEDGEARTMAFDKVLQTGRFA